MGRPGAEARAEPGADAEPGAGARAEPGALAAQAAAVWAFRARVEVDVARRFERLARELVGVGGAAVVVEHAAAAALDEHRHHQLCRELVTALAPPGAAPAITVAERAPPRLGPPELDLRDQVAFEVVALSCVMESLSVAALGRILERAADARVREVAQAILKDEIDHARLGWAHVAHALGPGARRALGQHLPALLAQTVGTELLGPPSRPAAASAEVGPPSRPADASAEVGPPSRPAAASAEVGPPSRPADASAAAAGGADAALRVSEPLEAWGALGRADRREVVRDTLRLVVLPGLARQGVDVSAGAAWAAALGSARA